MRKQYEKTEDHRRNLSDAAKKAWAEGRSRVHATSSEAGKKNCSLFWTEENRRKNLEGRKTEEYRKSRQLRSQKIWHLRSPSNKCYSFKNLAQFLRDNPKLFPEETLKPKRQHRRQAGPCLAATGLSRIRPDSRAQKPVGSWRGWTWISNMEVFYNGGDDLLDRENEMKPCMGREGLANSQHSTINSQQFP